LDGVYPEREDRRGSGKVRGRSTGLEGFRARRRRPGSESGRWIIEAVKTGQSALSDATDEAVLEAARQLRPLLKKQGLTQELVGRAFGLVREAAGRHLNMSHFDVQLIGGWALLKGMVAEMETGEGKTLTAALPACTLALAGVPVHIITVNDYLTARDAEWITPLYKALGLTVGTIVHGKDPAARREAYRCDITYCTNKEVAFDYLRDRLVLSDRPSQLRLSVERLYGEASRLSRLVMRGLHFAIVDEADSLYG
jgi:preprotein translocase subunit SecA